MSSQIGMPMPDAAEVDRPRHVRPGLEHALLVELAIIGQVELVALGQQLAAVGDDDRIVDAALALQRRAHDDARAAIRRVGDQRLGRALAGAQEGRLQTRSSGG